MTSPNSASDIEDTERYVDTRFVHYINGLVFIGSIFHVWIIFTYLGTILFDGNIPHAIRPQSIKAPKSSTGKTFRKVKSVDFRCKGD